MEASPLSPLAPLLPTAARFAPAAPPEEQPGAEPALEASAGAAESGERPAERQGPRELTDEEQAQVEALKTRDAEVRAHEHAHRAAAGGLAGPPTFSYTRGPDGRLYAVAGEVQIEVSPEPGDPEGTIAKAQQIRRAALAPAQPSGQDRAVAAQAAQMEAQARVELAAGRAARRAGQTPEEPGQVLDVSG